MRRPDYWSRAVNRQLGFRPKEVVEQFGSPREHKFFTKLFFAVAGLLNRKNKVIDNENSIGDHPNLRSGGFLIDFQAQLDSSSEAIRKVGFKRNSIPAPLTSLISIELPLTFTDFH